MLWCPRPRQLGDCSICAKVIDALYADTSIGAGDRMQLNLAFSTNPIFSAEPFPAVPSATAWEQLDEASRLAALDISARLIARMLSPGRRGRPAD